MKRTLALTACLCLLLAAAPPPALRSDAAQSADASAPTGGAGRTAKARKATSKSQPAQSRAAALTDGFEAQATQQQQSPIEDYGYAAGVPARSAAFERDLKSLLAEARGGREVRIIVGLAAPFQPEAILGGEQEAEGQRAGISAARETLLSRLAGVRAESVKTFDYIPYVALAADESTLQRLRESPEVVSIHEDIEVAPTLAESTQIIGAPAAWSAGHSGAGQTVAILDTGVDKNHPFLAGKVVAEGCYSTTSGTTSSVCPGGAAQSTASGSGLHCSANGCDHGTHVAGIAAGKSATFSGVARDASIIAVQVFSQQNDSAACQRSGFSAPCTTAQFSDIIKGLERVYALRGSHNIAAANMSLGGGQFSSTCDSLFGSVKAIIDNLRAAGIATVIASGNDGYKSATGAPACISTSISVGSTGDGSGGATQDVVVGSSNSAGFLNLLAPGRLINSSVPGGGFANFSGTSMAAPHVAGAWAVLKSRVPSASVTQVYTALRDTGLAVTDSNGITKPRIRVNNALQTLGGGGSGTPTPTPPPNGCGAAAAIAAGQTLGGSLSATDCQYPAGSGRFSDAYTFAGAAGQQVSVSMTSPAFDTFLYLVGPTGAVVAQDDDGGDGTNSRIPASGFFTLPSTGTYTIQASSFGNNSVGNYSVSLAAGTGGGCATSAIAAGQTVNGSLATSDCVLTGGYFADGYTFSGAQGQQISISLSSPTFDTYLGLIGPNNAVVAEDDDGGGGTNSRIPASGFFTLPQAGTYTVVATSFLAGATGSYSLTLTSQSTGGCAPAAIGLGQTLNGSLAASDCRFPAGSGYFTDAYTFAGAAGQQVSVSMSSSTFDTYLILAGPGGTILEENDDSGGSTNSRIPATGFFTLPQAGTYTVYASSFAQNTSGPYSLTLSGQTTGCSSSSPITAGQVVNASLATSDCRFPVGSEWYADAYTFSGTAGQQISISMSSLAFDTYLVLTGPGGLFVEDDDGGDGTNSRIPETGFYTLPATGAYTIVASSFYTNATGAYALSLNRGGSGCAYSISPTGRSLGDAAQASSFAVTTTAGCTWTATSNAGWITITAGSGGSGSGTVNYSVTANATAESRTGTITVAGQTHAVEQAAPAPVNGVVQFSAAALTVAESAGATGARLVVTRTGGTAGASTVSYATADDDAGVLNCAAAAGAAFARCDFATSIDTVTFAAGETQKTIVVPLIDDSHVEGNETFRVVLSSPGSNTTLGATTTATVTLTDNDAAGAANPIGGTPFFVRQHYLDFLSREPEVGQPWTGVLNNCANQFNQDPFAPSAFCDRILVSSSFFRSQEFEFKGLYVFLFYRAALGRLAQYGEIVADMRNVTGQTPQEVFQKRAAFADSFSRRAEFTAAYPAALTNAQFVTSLLGRYQLASITTPDPASPDTGGLVALTQADLVARLTAGTLSRAQVLRAFVQSREVSQREFNGAFVAMQYYGYLRRAPEQSGYNAWLGVINQDPNNFRQMINGFMNSSEYRLRFGDPNR